MTRLKLTQKFYSGSFRRKALTLFQFLLIGAGTLFLSGCGEEANGVLNPKGIVTYEERILLFDALALMLIVVIPVIIMSFAFVFKYRASHRTAEYKPNWHHSVFLEVLWWGIPIIIVVILGVLSWKATHRLDPYQRIEGKKVDLRVNVIALPWTWLFIYPDQNVATLNELVIPKGKQVEFWLSGDNSAMASFFVPQLASQIYTMAGMRTKLHVIATEEGTFRGLNAQYNGDGFSDNHFPVHVVDDNGMKEFFAKVKASPEKLTLERYMEIREPRTDVKPEHYSAVMPDLFQKVIDWYMGTNELLGKQRVYSMHHTE